MVIHFIETYQEYVDFCTVISGKPIMAFPVFDTAEHPNVSPISFYFFVFENQGYVVSYTHPDSLPTTGTIHIPASVVYTPSKAVLDQSGRIQGDFSIVDMNIWCHLKNIQYPSFQAQYPRRIVPMMKLLESLEPVVEFYRNHIDSIDITDVEYKRFTSNVDAIKVIENSGIKINPEIFSSFFHETKKPIVFSQYNVFTKTTRPSNSFGGVNFAALNKSDGSRAAFVPQNDMFIAIDFESFHLRILAELSGFKFTAEPIHSQMAKIYFDTDSPTQQEYEDGKQLTFSYLYGDRDEVPHPFFSHLYKLKDYLWNRINKDGYLTFFDTRLELSDIDSPTKSKVLNYVVQLIEAQMGYDYMKKMIPLLSDELKCVLYTYDSFVFDVKMNAKTKDSLKTICNILVNNDKFPIRMYYGTNYNEMKMINM